MLLEAEGSFQGGTMLWSKADDYYYRSIARLQRLWEVILSWAAFGTGFPQS